MAVATGLPPPSSVAHMSSTWLLDIGAKQRKLILVGLLLFVGQFGAAGMTFVLIMLDILLFCRLYLEGHTGCGSGRSCNWQEHRSYSDL